MRQAITTFYENHGVVISDLKNVAKPFLPPNRKTEFEQSRGHWMYNTRPTCRKCGKVGHRTVDCFSYTSWRDQGSITCYYCKQAGHISPNCPYHQGRNNNDEVKNDNPAVTKKQEKSHLEQRRQSERVPRRM